MGEGLFSLRYETFHDRKILQYMALRYSKFKKKKEEKFFCKFLNTKKR